VTARLRASTSASRPDRVALREEICEANEDLRDSSSRMVMVGILRGVGTGGSSKSRRLRMFWLFFSGVDVAVDLRGERWFWMYERSWGSPDWDLLGERRVMELMRCENVEIASNCWVKSSNRFVVSFSATVPPALGVGVADGDILPLLALGVYFKSLRQCS
jgi:hypothetical protein